MAATVIEGICERGAVETASRVLQHLNGAFLYGQAKELCRDNPARSARADLPDKENSRRMAALIDFASLGDMLRRAQAARLSRPVYLAHRLIAFTAMRISNVVEAEWREFDLEAEQPVWTIPRGKLKKKDPNFPDHRVPLAPAIAAELREWRAVIGGRGCVFPSLDKPGQPISRESLEKSYRVTLGLKDKHTPHGWRASFTSQARDHGFERDLVLLATDHAHDSEVALAYDRGERFSQRVALFNWWGEQLIAAQTGAKIVALSGKREAA
jgi:integrase